MSDDKGKTFMKFEPIFNLYLHMLCNACRNERFWKKSWTGHERPSKKISIPWASASFQISIQGEKEKSIQVAQGT